MNLEELTDEERALYDALPPEARAQVDAMTIGELRRSCVYPEPRFDRQEDGALPFTTMPIFVARRELVAFPQTLFRGFGLWLWGCDETTLVHAIRVGLQPCFSVVSAPIAGLYFEAGLSFEAFGELVTDRELCPMRLKSALRAPPHQRIRMPTAELGNTITLDVEGPIRHAVIWGKTIR